MHFSIIVPAFNEEQNIRKTVLEIHRIFKHLSYDFEIIVVNDGSKDFTKEIIDALIQEIPYLQAIHLQQNHGKGHAVRKGMVSASGDYIVFIDADMDIHPSRINHIVEQCQWEKVDVAIGSKRHPDSEIDYPLSRRIISAAYHWVVRILFGLKVKDTQAGLKIYKKEVLQSILPKLLVKKFAFDLEMLVAAHRLNYRIAEFPIKVIFARKFGRITLRDCFYAGIDTLAIFYRHRLLDFYNYSLAMNTDSPKVSVIVAVKQSNENLKRCIDACMNQDYENFEVIVVPNERSEVLSTAFKRNNKITIVPSGTVNPSVKRNFGAQRSTGDILAFLDDDAFPNYDWISTAVRQFGNDKIAAVGGSGITPADSSFRERISGYVYASLLVSGPYRYRYIPHRYQEVDELPSCNLFVLKKAFNAIGGFPVQHWPGEDTLLCRNIIKEKKKIVYDPHVMVEHKRRPVFLKHLAQVSRYAMHRGFFVKHYPENSFQFSYFVPSLLVLFFLLGPMFLYLDIIKLYQVVIGAYLISTALFSINMTGIPETVCKFVGIIATHFIYGTFFLVGLLRKSLSTYKILT